MTTPNMDPIIAREPTVTCPEPFRETNGSPPSRLAEEQDMGDLAYQPVPPVRSNPITVHVQVRGRGQPLPYLLDEEGEE
jgi:hypothetical protein